MKRKQKKTYSWNPSKLPVATAGHMHVAGYQVNGHFGNT